MPGATVDIATGITVVFATSGFTSELVDVDWSGISREAIDVTHQGVVAAPANNFGNRVFTPGDLIDGGEVTLALHFDADQNPPIGEVLESIAITWPKVPGDTTAAVWTFNGFATQLQIGAALGEKMTAALTLKASGNVAQTDAA